jgi:hypothetical protein
MKTNNLIMMTFTVVLAACGSERAPAVQPELCGVTPESCAPGITTGTTEITSAPVTNGAGTAANGQALQRSTTRTNSRESNAMRTDEGANSRAIPSPHGPNGGNVPHGGLPPKDVPRPVNTGDPCGWCK